MIDDCKQQIAAASSELTVALLPIVLEFIDIAQTTIIPILTKVAGWVCEYEPGGAEVCVLPFNGDYLVA
ncbi:MAG: hypothetical protein ACOX2Y_03030 [Christensenellales bacterium]